VAITTGLGIGTCVTFALGMFCIYLPGRVLDFPAAATHVVAFYLDPKNKKEFTHILELIKQTDDQSAELLRGYVREGMRTSRAAIY
jgi:hypothetical protein